MKRLLLLLLSAAPAPTPPPPAPPLGVSRGGSGASALKCTSSQVLSSDGGRFYCTSAAGTVSTAAPIVVSGGNVTCRAAAENLSGCITGNAAAVQDLSGIFVFKQRLATRGSHTYDAPTSLYASMDVSAGIAVDGPVFPNTDGNQLRLTGRRTDQVSGIRLEAQRWIDGGVVADVPFPWPCNNTGSIMSWKPEGTYFGGDLDRTCSGTGNLYQGALIDNGGVAGHYTMLAGNALSLTFAGNLSANIAIETDGGRPYNDGGNPLVCTQADGGAFYCYAGRHGAVIASTRANMQQGLIFQVDNVARAEGNHVFYVTHWGSFGQDDQIVLANFPPANAQNIPTSGGQYITGYSGELAHDAIVAGDENTGHWRTRHVFADAGAQWVTLVDTSQVKSGTCTLDGASPSKCSVVLPKTGSNCSCSGKGTSAAVANAGCAWNVVGYTATFYSSNGLTHDVGYMCL